MGADILDNERYNNVGGVNLLGAARATSCRISILEDTGDTKRARRTRRGGGVLVVRAGGRFFFKFAASLGRIGADLGGVQKEPVER